MQVDHKNRSVGTAELPKPLLLGRSVRLLLGIGIGSMLLLTAPAEIDDPDGLFWFLVLYAFLSLPDLFEVFFGLQWQRKSQVLFLLLGLVAAALDFVLYQQLWQPLLARFVYGVVVAVVGTQAVSFLLAALLRTPGCEWRAIPHLFALLKDKEAEVEPCSLYLHKLDQWEARRS